MTDADETSDGPTFLLVWLDGDGEPWRCEADDEPRLDAAVTQWCDSGETRDTVVLLTTTGGALFKARASRVTAWILSTPADRERERAVSEALKAEGGLPWEQEE